MSVFYSKIYFEIKEDMGTSLKAAPGAQQLPTHEPVLKSDGYQKYCREDMWVARSLRIYPERHTEE